jgi:N-methylhydantoinase A
MHYRGQSFELVLPVPDGPFDAGMVAHLEEAFGREHEKTYGHRAGPEEPVELVSIQVVARGTAAGAAVPGRLPPRKGMDRPQSERRAYFGEPHGWIATPVIARGELTTRRVGPLIVEEYDATTLVPPGTAARVDASGNILIDLG